MSGESHYLYDMSEYPWQSPRRILLCADEIIGIVGDEIRKNKYLKVREAKAVAILLLGLYKIQNIKYFMQISRTSSPDIVTVRQIERRNLPIKGEFVEVEVVEYTDNSKEDNIVDFLKNTKLSKEKSYDNLTVILCVILRKKLYVNYEDTNQRLGALSPNSNIYILGELNGQEHIYQMWKAWPVIQDLTDINVISIANSYPGPHDVLMKLSMDKKINYYPISRKRPTCFEIFGLK